MRTYDLHIHASPPGESSAVDVIDFAKRLGWSGIALSCFPDSEEIVNSHAKMVDDLKSKDFDVVKAIEIKADTINALHKALDSFRRKTEIVIVRGGDQEINRAAVETNQVDIISHPESQRSDSGIDQVMARSAADNNVSVELNFRQILNSYRKTRVHIIAHMRQNIKLAKKYGFPVAITSGAYSKWELRAPRELAAFGVSVGMELEGAFRSLEAGKIEVNRNKLNQNWVMPGVTISDG
ncbi:MAG: hypothetical protein HYT71_03225 [Candidatus Aenigmarchaeota archaeon]|nr:hypothetical protein [Candidatus Aenigmarchaeota archaeon]